MDVRVMAHFQEYQFEVAKRRVLEGFRFLMDDNANSTSKEQAKELIGQFKNSFFFEKLELPNEQPELYHQTHFYALMQDHDNSCNYEFILRIRKYAHRDGYECHISIQRVQYEGIVPQLHLERHNFDLPVNA